MSETPEHVHDNERGVAVAPARPEVVPPPMFEVVLLNDDFTPMDFVVEVLRVFFGMNQQRAVQIMLHVH
ncbi:MAG: ATP-dependent Clp protease adaptor ClpS, partial [Xanthomonadales bacterium]|nr:ATP-dependent Clp protease adaptor ClpS [Xanthomonadales bacterium]